MSYHSSVLNTERATQAAVAFDTYRNDRPDEDPQTLLIDLLTDLRHLAVHCNYTFDFEAAVRLSDMHFAEERTGDV